MRITKRVAPNHSGDVYKYQSITSYHSTLATPGRPIHHYPIISYNCVNLPDLQPTVPVETNPGITVYVVWDTHPELMVSNMGIAPMSFSWSTSCSILGHHTRTCSIVSVGISPIFSSWSSTQPHLGIKTIPWGNLPWGNSRLIPTELAGEGCGNWTHGYTTTTCWSWIP